MVAADDSIARLRWRCRRGTREMDLLLLRFLEQNYPNLEPSEQSLFSRLLDETDPDLYGWITGQAKPSNPDYLPIIGKINGCSGRDSSSVIVNGDRSLSNDRDDMKHNER